MDFGSISWVAVIVAAVAFFAFGGVWYGPLFSKAWMRASGVTEDQARESNMALIFGGTLVLNVVSALGLAAVIGQDASVVSGLAAGLAVAVLFVLASLAVLSLYERRSSTLLALNSGYNLIGFAIMGAIIGALQ